MRDLQAEKEQVEEAKHNPEAFGELYDQNFSAIFNYCLRRTGDAELARDITGETFVKALANIKSFKWRDISFSAWLYRIAGNEISSFFRKNSYKAVSLEYLQEVQGYDPESQYGLEDEVIAAEQELKRHEDYMFYRQKISQLPLKYQEIIALRYFEGKSLKESAEILGKPEGTVKSLLHRGLDKLRAHMRDK